MLYATRLEVDLDAIAHNIRQAKTMAPEAKVLVAVKANAYGHGAVAVARKLAALGLADWFGVATTPEGVELREAGITTPILRLSQAFPEELATLIAAGITPAVTDQATISAVARAAEAQGRSGYPVHLAIDTGMRRIGCEAADALATATLIAQEPALQLQGVFTHLPISDCPAGQQFTTEQLARFHQCVAEIQTARIAQGLPPVPLVHAANSGAVLGHEIGAATMIRPGIMAYGYYPDALETPRPVELRQAACWKSRISFVKSVPAGQSVGYGRTWSAPVDSWIGTVPVGYADGYSRLNSNRGRMLVGGRSWPIAGRVCMDQTMLNLGPVIPGQPAPVAAGDEVVLLGGQGNEFISTDEVAALMGTISYEVTCLIAPRVTRIHLGEAAE